jgi:hypothetical protein
MSRLSEFRSAAFRSFHPLQEKPKQNSLHHSIQSPPTQGVQRTTRFAFSLYSRLKDSISFPSLLWALSCHPNDMVCSRSTPQSLFRLFLSFRKRLLPGFDTRLSRPKQSDISRLLRSRVSPLLAIHMVCLIDTHYSTFQPGYGSVLLKDFTVNRLCKLLCIASFH